jgi:DNA-binding transcriptional LysR family regulator
LAIRFTPVPQRREIIQVDKFQAMQAFVRVVETGSFTKAADTLDTPKPTLSRLIQNLESELDTKLLNRTTRKVSVTTDGAAYYDRAVRLLGDLLELEGVMSKAKSNPRGCLKVDFLGPIGLSMIIPALPEFVARYPNIHLDIGINDLPRDLSWCIRPCSALIPPLTHRKLPCKPLHAAPR